MKLADFFINLGVKGDTKKLDETIKKMESVEAKEKSKLQFKQKHPGFPGCFLFG